MKKSILFLAAAAGLLYFPVPGADPCRAVALEERGYLMRVGLLSGFESDMTVEIMTADTRESMKERFSWRPASWSCAMAYWQIKLRPDILGESMKAEFKRQFLSEIVEQGGDPDVVTDMMIDKLYLEFLQTYGVHK